MSSKLDDLSAAGAFNAAAAEQKPKEPEKPAPQMHLRPDGAIVQQVHSELRDQQVSPPLRDDNKAADFKRNMAVRREFNRAARNAFENGCER